MFRHFRNLFRKPTTDERIERLIEDMRDHVRVIKKNPHTLEGVQYSHNQRRVDVDLLDVYKRSPRLTRRLLALIDELESESK